jgi:hypothetical protein
MILEDPCIIDIMNFISNKKYSIIYFPTVSNMYQSTFSITIMIIKDALFKNRNILRIIMCIRKTDI